MSTQPPIPLSPLHVFRRALENIKFALNNSRANDEALHTIGNEVSWALSHVHPTPDSSLIEKLEALKIPKSFTPRARAGFLLAKEEAIAIVRQHEAEQPRDVVERVKLAMLATRTDVVLWDEGPLTELANAAIAAKGDANYSGSIERESHIAPETDEEDDSLEWKAGYECGFEAGRLATKPVSIPLHVAARAIMDSEVAGRSTSNKDAREFAKAVLNAAGVKYVD